jgi:hypothetical protein
VADQRDPLAPLLVVLRMAFRVRTKLMGFPITRTSKCTLNTHRLP